MQNQNLPVRKPLPFKKSCHAALDTKTKTKNAILSNRWSKFQTNQILDLNLRNIVNDIPETTRPTKNPLTRILTTVHTWAIRPQSSRTWGGGGKARLSEENRVHVCHR